MESCLNIFSVACHSQIWDRWGTSVELTLSLWEMAQILLLVTFALIARKIYVDPIKRDIFFGYLPTVMVYLKDRKSGKVIMVSYSYHEEEDPEGERSEVWYFPQSVMESADLGKEIRRVAESKLGLSTQHFRFTDRIYHSKRYRAYGFNKYLDSDLGFSFLTKARGRVYHVCEIEADIEQRGEKLFIMDREIASMNIQKVRLVSPGEAIRLVEESHKGYRRRKSKIPIMADILSYFGK